MNSFSNKKSVVITGNGCSLKNIDYTRLPQEYDVFRSNHFYAEDKYYIGKKIKMALFVVPYFFNEYYTINKLISNKEYECEHIVCKMYNFQDRKEKIFRDNFKYFFPAATNGYDNFFSKLKKLSDMIDFDFCYNGITTEMLTGTYLIACAVACGYENIYIAGMDFLDDDYTYFDNLIAPAGVSFDREHPMHDKNYDVKIIQFLQDEYNANIMSICPNSSINHIIKLAPIRDNKRNFIIENRMVDSIREQLIPPAKSVNRYKRIYLENNLLIKALYAIIQTPRALRHYFSKTKYTR
ncbi:alpha-2,3-sialyltransferase [Campylobacter volucris]|uniref:alpha-2,3-sialyltransferase n=1 Tax=Campylobacter volucris TaxID=1031542 RepID=UPI00189CD4CD|nr:alpha-2,3-sialyltransferase [Campylobacter volucris]MBF7044905.1 alpha-2,3 sialyltransferase [Campylobacter volucris]